MLKIHQILRLIIALSFFCFGFTQMAWAGFEEARDAYEREDYTTAFREYNLLAEQGDAEAQFFLGVMYANGKGVPKDEQQAAVWWRKAAEQGYGKAQHNLGFMYKNGQGVPKDEKLAVEWYRKAAEQGYALAQQNLGVMYANGKGVPKDEQQAEVWFKKAAEQGHAMAQFSLGIMYANGEGVPKDEKLAVEWYRKAAEQGYSRAQFNLGRMYTNGKGLSKDDQQAELWYRKAAEQGYVLAQVVLGGMYSDGKGVTKNDQQAELWYRKAAEQGDFNAQILLGLMHFGGVGVPHNKQRAYFWWLLASANDNERAKEFIDKAEESLSPQQRAQAQADARDWRPSIEQQVAQIGLPNADEKGLRDTFKRAPRAPQTKIDKSSGTGFVVSPNQIVTNLHVVDGCVVLKVNGNIATISVMDTSNDLALITTSRNSNVAALRVGDLRQGDEVNAVGYPLYGLLASGAQITSGNVSALAGMQNDSRFIQISTPVQPGNSGGPLVDASGNVVGVISSKLNALAIATLNGDIPQNINFAISPLVLKGFLEANQVKYKTAVSNKKMSTADVMNIATRYTVLVECTK